jgi:DNA polymerase delta subunit 2
MAPTCPDHLESISFEGDDPFAIKDLPNLYICGNQPEFCEEWVEDVKVIGVPSFEETMTMVLVDLGNLETKQIRFSSAYN